MREAIPADAAARAHALDPRRSFIVQAPAGSGKTELLIRRTLVLLAQAESPEQIVALTFTRKAAAEMRERLLGSLARAREATPPADSHELATWTLARAARARDLEQGWSLADSPGRLRILTLDSLCALLVRRLPLLARLGGMPAVQDDATPLYREAARATLGLLEDGSPEQSAAVGTVLLHLDNRSGAVEALLVGLLARRDQWIRHVARHDQGGDRALLEQALLGVRLDALAQARTLLQPLAQRIVPLAAWAADNLPEAGAAPLRACRSLEALPGDTDDAAPVWLGLADLLLTQGGTLRRRVDKRQGFPAAGEARDAEQKRRFEDAKQAFADLVAAAESIPGLAEALAALAKLPPARYEEAQWEVLGAVAEMLRLAAAQLALVFAARGAADFTAIAQGALHALGTSDAPSDLLLALDARIRHLLVDEFQDTSVTQFELIERLTAGWAADDGRTLFVVGDPMQSIYRFREAEVGLFLRARQFGVGDLALQPLRLSTNFRSAQGVVDWVNTAFAQVLPAREDIARGAVSYEPASHWHPPGATPAVSVHALVDAGDAAEADRVAGLVAQARAAHPAGSIAVLVRGRAHLAAIVPALQARGIALRAVEIESLADRPVVLDLLALTRALLHPADRIAWLAVLRAPWCGLTLADLHAIAAGDARRPVWDLLDDPARLEQLSGDGRARVAALATALAPALADAQRSALRDAVEGAWLRLGAADCLREPRDLDDVRAYLDLLDALAPGGELPEVADIEARMARLFAAPQAGEAEAAVQIMTIHKAKGLEFDVVVVPGLHRRPRTGTPQLLAWAEVPNARGGLDLVLGALPSSGAEDDGVHAWIGRLERSRERLEAGRLLYVAATRARRQLHLLGCASSVERKAGRELSAPSADSLLAALWPVVQAQFEAALDATVPANAPGTAADADDGNAALVLDARTWRRPTGPAVAADDARLPRLVWHAEPPAAAAAPPVEFSWAGETARLVGTVVHRWLQRIADRQPAWDAAAIDAQRAAIEQDLASAGVPACERGAALERTLTALRGTVSDERGRWLLMRRAPAAQAASELRLTGVDGGARIDIAIDRTFTEDGVRWVIDYKTGSHEGTGREAFLEREQLRYRPQLERYARLIGSLDGAPVRCGLYFPLLLAWRAWDAPV